MLRVALFFYTICAGVAVVWCGVAGHPWVFWVGPAPELRSVLQGVAGGVGFGVVVVLLTRFGLDSVQWMRELAEALASAVGPLRWRDAFALALLSSFGEEMLFRGALQPSVGWPLATMCFALVHFPAERRLVPWTLMAGALGLVFALATEAQGHLAFAVAGHFTVNLFNLMAIAPRPSQ